MKSWIFIPEAMACCLALPTHAGAIQALRFASPLSLYTNTYPNRLYGTMAHRLSR